MPRVVLTLASAADATAVAAVRNAAAEDLTARHGVGPWSGRCTAKGVLFGMRRDGRVYVVRRRGRIVGTLMLAQRKPWSLDGFRFTAVKHPLYLVDLAIMPAWQDRGLGRACLAEAAKVARASSAEAIRLDAFDHPTGGAGRFYAKCGYRKVARATYRHVPLIYYELLLRDA
jgi:ribosomal protein S18 acetylase RimI-like enzyme